MRDTLVFTVAHTGVKRFYPEFLNSMMHQENREFDFLVVEECHLDYDALGAIYITSSETLAGNRELAIRYAIDKGYKTLIPLDGDDRYYPDKIGFLKKERKPGAHLFHDLRIINEHGDGLIPYFIGSRIHDRAKICAEDILYYNMIGFGNTAFDVSLLEACLPIPDELMAIDWWVAMCSLLNGSYAEYRNVVLSDYRQHSSNIATWDRVDMEAVSKEMTLKKLHYSSLLERCSSYHPLYKKISNALQDVLDYIADVCPPDVISNDYPMWWETSYRCINKRREVF